MITYVFPGQGSQYQGMGEALFTEFRDFTVQADEILGYSIKSLCLGEDAGLDLNKTQFTQPALYVVNSLSYLQKIRGTGKKPDFVAGHSLGEYNALLASGAVDFATGLKLVQKRGELMSLATDGGMAAVIGLNEAQVAAVLREENLQMIDIANCNTADQIVISGKKEDIDRAKPVFESIKAVKMVASLKVSGAFHSRYMNEAKREFEKLLNTFAFNPLTIPVIANVDARPYRQENLKTTLANQINSSVKWTESIRYLMGQGEMEFEEVGPGHVLIGLIRRIQTESEPLLIQG